MIKTDARSRGILGEESAGVYLQNLGWKIIARNYRGESAEIDLIACRDGLLAFVEVKARSAGCLAEPVCAVGRAKRGRIVRCAQRYLLDHPEYHDLQPRFDIAEVLLDRGGRRAEGIRYLPGAFTLDDI